MTCPASNEPEPDRERREDRERPGSGDQPKPANAATDAVKDPNEKTDGKPGLPPGADQGDETDPGGG